MDTQGCLSRNPGLSRRRVLQSCAAMGALATLGAGAAPPKETGLASEGLLAGQAGFQPRQPAPLPHAQIEGFLSPAQLAACYRAYRQAFAQLKAAEAALQSASRAPAAASAYARLRSQQVRAGNAVLLHEFYFGNLAATAPAPARYIAANMAEHMGSFAAWREDFAACARVARDWALLVYDPYDDRWHNVALGADDAGGWVGANPLVVCNVSTYAYSLDYADRDAYVSKFVEHLDWNAVGARYRAVDRH